MNLYTTMTVLPDAVTLTHISNLAAALCAAFTVLGAAFGISRIGTSAMEAIARQPESAKDIQSNMIVAAALIEGVAFFSLVIAFLILFV